MRKLLVIVVFLFGSTQLFSQETEPQEDKNLELKEQSIYSEENQEESVPKSFTLDPMSVESSDGEPEEIIEIPETPTPPYVEKEKTVTLEKTEEEYVAPSDPHPSNKHREKIQTLSGSHHHSGGFGAISFKATNFNNKNIVMAGIRGGWIINRSIAIGIDGYGIIPTAEFRNIDPYFNTRVVGGYGGLFIEPIVLSNKLVHVTFPVSAGAGWLGYIYDWEDVGYSYKDDLVDGDVYWYIEPGASLELNVSRNFRINFGASYRFTQDLELINTSSNAFEDWNYFMTLKFGRF